MGSFDVLLEDERTQLDAFVEEYRAAIEATLDELTEEQARRHLVSSATAAADLPLAAIVTGHHSGPRTLRWVYLQVLRELAQHCGHADILREQVLAE